MATGFNPWIVPADPFHPNMLGSIEEGEVRYVSLDKIHYTPLPVAVMWVSRLTPSSRIPTGNRPVAIEREGDTYWVWLDGRSHEYVREAEHVFPEEWAIHLQIVSDVTRPGVRPPADRPQTRRTSVVTDPRDPASTGMANPSYLVMIDAMAASGCADSTDNSSSGDCEQDAPTVQVDMTPAAAADAGSASPSHHAPHDPGTTHSPSSDVGGGHGHSPSHDGGGGGWADGGGGFSCGGGGV